MLKLHYAIEEEKNFLKLLHLKSDKTQISALSHYV